MATDQNQNSYIGKQIGGDYRITAALNGGSFGNVYLAQHIIFEDDPIVAIKLLHSNLHSSEEREQFVQEARLLRKLRHPHILPVIGAGFQDSTPYIVTEYASSGSLRDRLNKHHGQPLPLEEALTILTQVGEALHHAHQQNIVHRDLKPENILFNARGEALLADFGIAAILATAKTKQMGLGGTPSYMAPEQFEGIISMKSDQYALGCIAYELLTGQKPFMVPNPTLEAMWYHHAKVYPVAPTQINPLIPAHIEQAIFKAIFKQRADRHADVTAFITSLQKTANQWFDEGFALGELNRHEEALAPYEQGLHLNPNDADAYLNKGVALDELNRPSTDLDLSSALDVESPREPLFSRFEALQHFGQQISPIVIPLVFGGMTFLFILSLFRTDFPYLHSNLLWPIALVLIALAVLQGMGLYYAGANNVFWSLGVVTGFCLFMLVGCFVIFGPWLTGILFTVLIILVIVAGRFSMRPVPEGTVDIVYSFRKYTRTLYPGLNFILPWERIDTRLHTRERQWTCPEQIIQISRTEDIHLKATLSYQLMPEDAHLAIAQVDKWEENLYDLFTATLQDVSGKLKPEDFMAWRERERQNPNLFLRPHKDEDASRWEPINNLVFQRMRDRVALWGVIINWVQVRDITHIPQFQKDKK